MSILRRELMRREGDNEAGHACWGMFLEDVMTLLME